MVEISTPLTRYWEHFYGKKLSRLKSSINVVLFVKSRKKLSPMMNEKPRCNTLIEYSVSGQVSEYTNKGSLSGVTPRIASNFGKR